MPMSIKGVQYNPKMLVLPIEIHERIIGLLESGRSAGTVANCALVCRQWLPFSRYKLYHVVRLDNFRQWIRFRNLMLTTDESLPIAGYLRMVRELDIHGDSRDVSTGTLRWKRVKWDKNEQRPWVHLALEYSSARLSRSTKIHLTNIDWSQTWNPIICCANFSALTTLVLSGCRFSDVRQLHRFVAAFPSLGDLSLFQLSLRSTSTHSCVLKGHPLQRLTFAPVEEETLAVLQWLTNAGWVQKLTYLQGATNQNVPDEEWETLIENIDGPSLQELDIEMNRCWRGSVLNLNPRVADC